MKGLRVLSLLGEGANSKIAKKGSPGDIVFYAAREGEVDIELMEPALYPEKIQPLAFCLTMCDFALFKPDLTKKDFPELLGSLIVAGKKGALVGEGSKDVIAPYVKGTALESWPELPDDPIAIRQHLSAQGNCWAEGETRIMVDQSFNLKSIGVVALGAIVRGTIRVHDELTLFPSGKKVTVKSLQLHDSDVPEITNNSRVGANIKGATQDDAPRGSVIAGSQMVSESFGAEISCPAFAKGGIEKGRKVFAALGMQYVEATPDEAVPGGKAVRVRLVCDRPMVYEKNDRVLIVDPNRKPRIIGSGVVL
jgi:selenocysteine-specific translation elongation factor